MNAPNPTSPETQAVRPAGPIARLFEKIGGTTQVPFRIVFADGSEFRQGAADPAFTLAFRSRAAQWRVLRDGHIGFLEGYFDGGIAFHGYPDVPVVAASHGCVRVPPKFAREVYNLLPLGTRVDVIETSMKAAPTVT